MNSPRELALQVLLRVEEENAFSNLLLGNVLNKENLTPVDRGLMTEIVYGTITWRDRLDYMISKYVKGSPKKVEKWVWILLRLSFYQFLFLERVPTYAVVNEAVNIAKKRGHQGISSFVNGILRAYLRDPNKADIPNDLPWLQRIAIEQSHPQWLVERWQKAFGKIATELICKANNVSSHISIRANRLKTDSNTFIERLHNEQIEVKPSEIYPYGFRITSVGNPIAQQSYQAGLYTIQDESSMLVSHLLDPKPGMRVLDACAAPGGKTTHIAELMNNQGEIIANELHLHKEKLIQEQASRLGISIIKTSIGDALDLKDQQIGTFDRILLDAPCTGFGVIRRKPDLKWNKQASDIKAISYVQYELLVHVAKLLKPEGKLIYSTCTIEVDENQKLIEKFLHEHPQFKLDIAMKDDLPTEALKEKVETPGMLQILPHYWGTDGFFIARLIYA